MGVRLKYILSKNDFYELKDELYNDLTIELEYLPDYDELMDLGEELYFNNMILDDQDRISALDKYCYPEFKPVIRRSTSQKELATTISLMKKGQEFWIYYPLSKYVCFEILEDQTPRQFVESIIKAYNLIYKMESATSNIKEHPLYEDENSSLINRCQTNGIFGIWGHVLEDLSLPCISLRSSNNKNIQDLITISCDS